MKEFLFPKYLRRKSFYYCAGCGHGIIHRIIAEAVEELLIAEKLVGVSSVGCSAMSYDYFNFDFQASAHGRAPAQATGIKRVSPNLLVFTYQGDGDMTSIGISEIIHTAARGEKITAFMVNNANFASTGGQMSPTTIPDQVTTTSPSGRNPKKEGFPIDLLKLISQLEMPNYLVRGSIDTPNNILKAKKYIKKAFKYQIHNTCFSLVELLSPCPTQWGKSPLEAREWMRLNLYEEFELGEIKTPDEQPI